MLSPSASPNLDPNGTNAPPPPQNFEPFAKVDHVMPGSPANMAGLQEGDLLSKFGSVTAENFCNLTNVAAVVQHSVNSAIQVSFLITYSAIQVICQLINSTNQVKVIIQCFYT
ncbi:26S proteasome non-ATPase regulatory subunit 9 [Portunus trituberculatus]|uniref:26S proteasome non-ATPase regulatory subunit 9 n=1 Tax=Portunus trituberculatus TaxID=210409 RepID=A0A5B7IS79_PORTR|nr:26S proteasome non-ATPase regulatory subunit 9 [Portunus trituberculatus]